LDLPQTATPSIPMNGEQACVFAEKRSLLIEKLRFLEVFLLVGEERYFLLNPGIDHADQIFFRI
jgi:hypothetical protein